MNTVWGLGVPPTCALKFSGLGLALISAVLLTFNVTGMHRVPGHPAEGVALEPGAVNTTFAVYVPGAIPLGATPTVKEAGVAVALGVPTRSQFTPLLVVVILDVTVKPKEPMVLLTLTVWVGGAAWPVWKLNSSEDLSTESV